MQFGAFTTWKRLTSHVTVNGSFIGRTSWDGTVEVFQLHSHPKATHVYAWSYDTDDPAYPKRYITVLHLGPVTSAPKAVQEAIMKGLMVARAEA